MRAAESVDWAVIGWAMMVGTVGVPEGRLVPWTLTVEALNKGSRLGMPSPRGVGLRLSGRGPFFI
jgi:hypothetical protein